MTDKQSLALSRGRFKRHLLCAIAQLHCCAREHRNFHEQIALKDIKDQLKQLEDDFNSQTKQLGLNTKKVKIEKITYDLI